MRSRRTSTPSESRLNQITPNLLQTRSARRPWQRAGAPPGTVETRPQFLRISTGACGCRIAISPKIPQDSPSCYHSSMRNLAANAGSARVTTNCQPPLVSMATPLSGPLSDRSGCLICPRLALAAIFGQPPQNSQEIIRRFSIAACFAAPIVSLPPGAYRK